MFPSQGFAARRALLQEVLRGPSEEGLMWQGMAKHFEIYPRRLRSFEMPSIRQLQGVVSSQVFEAMVEASEQLRSLGILHALAGGLAVSAWGRPRWTKDVDFVVDQTALDISSSGIVSFKAGVPLQVRGVAVDPILPRETETHLFHALRHPVISDGIPILPVEPLIYMKLEAGRSKDLGDVAELLRSGTDERSVRKYIEEHAPKLLKRLEQAVQEAAQ